MVPPHRPLFIPRCPLAWSAGRVLIAGWVLPPVGSQDSVRRLCSTVTLVAAGQTLGLAGFVRAEERSVDQFVLVNESRT